MMKKFVSRGLAALLLLVFCFALSVPAGASVYASEYLSRFSGSITARGGGVLKISYIVIGTKTLDELGISEIVVEKKIGSSWIEADTFTESDYPEFAATDSSSLEDYILYDGVAGIEYRAKITGYGNTDYRTITTSSVRAT